MQVRPARPSEYDEIVELVGNVFPAGDAAEVLTTATIQHDPRFRPEHLRVVEDNRQLVGMVNVIDRFVRVGSVQVRCGIVAPLAVARDYQGRGVGSTLMRDCLNWLTHEGFGLSMLWGHTWLYPRYGYAPGLKSYEVVVPASLHPRGDAAYTLRAYNPADAPALMHVYHSETARTTLAEVRSDGPWEWRPHRSDTLVEVALDPARVVRGYMRVDASEGHLHVGELFAMDTGAAQALYDRLLHLARERGVAEIRVRATPKNRWSRLAFRQGARVCVSSGDGAGMVRPLNLPTLLETLLPELERRIASSDYVMRRTQVQIETPVGHATLHVDQGKVSLSKTRSVYAVTLPFHALGPLLTGYLPIAELEGLSGVFVHGRDTVRLIDVLFPEGDPHWSFAAYFG